jgi:two-component system response regulator AtoC
MNSTAVSAKSESLAPMTVLVVDDDDVTRRLLKEVLEKEGYVVRLAASGEEAVSALGREPFPIIVSDIRMLELDGMGVLRAAKQRDSSAAVILMTGFGSMEGAIEAIQEGAFDYVSKPFKIDELKSVVSRAAKHWESTHGGARKAGAHAGRLEVSAKALIGKSPTIVEVYKTLARAAMSASTVLIAGESGTGKELVARAIHDNGARRAKRFVAVNCGALAEGLLESELFGHVKGSVAGALGDKRGLFEDAHEGTLFLDEIGDVSPALQIKLLRVLQENEFKPVGSDDIRKVDARVIAATHHDLDALVRAGRFREDLYYRLKVIQIELPPLRERLEDLPELVGHFLARYADRSKKAVSHVSDEAMQLLRSYAWPGNIRELEHAIERAVAMSNTTVLFPEDFPAEISRGASAGLGAGAASVQAAGGSEQEGASTSLEEMEKAHIMKVLQEVSFNKSKASEVLGIDRATLYRKAQRYGIDLRSK